MAAHPSVYPTDSSVYNGKEVSAEIAAARLLRKKRHAECTDVIFIDLNGVLGAKVPLDSPLGTDSDYCTTYCRFKERPDAIGFVRHLQSLGFYVVIYTSMEKHNATNIVEKMGMTYVIDGVLSRDHCSTKSFDGVARKSIEYALKYLRLDHRIREEDCYIIDDSREKLSLVPEYCRVVVKTYDPFDSNDSAYNLMKHFYFPDSE